MLTILSCQLPIEKDEKEHGKITVGNYWNMNYHVDYYDENSHATLKLYDKNANITFADFKMHVVDYINDNSDVLSRSHNPCK